MRDSDSAAVNWFAPNRRSRSSASAVLRPRSASPPVRWRTSSAGSVCQPTTGAGVPSDGTGGVRVGVGWVTMASSGGTMTEASIIAGRVSPLNAGCRPRSGTWRPLGGAATRFG